MGPANARCGFKHALCTARQLALIIVTAATLAACGTTETVNRASQFANAGIAYAEALPPLFDEFFNATVTADSI